MIPQRFPRYLKNHFMLWTLARIPTYRCLKRLNSSGTYRRCFEKAFCIWRGVKESVSLTTHVSWNLKHFFLLSNIPSQSAKFFWPYRGKLFLASRFSDKTSVILRYQSPAFLNFRSWYQLQSEWESERNISSAHSLAAHLLVGEQ